MRKNNRVPAGGAEAARHGELDYLLATLAGVGAELALLDDVARGAYTLVEFPASELPAAGDVVAKCHDLEIELADTSIIVLGARFGTNRVLTNDDRRFRALRTLEGGAFQLLPLTPCRGRGSRSCLPTFQCSSSSPAERS